jgi:hypothetical protein
LACASLDAASVVYQGAGYTAGDHLMLAGTGGQAYTDTGALHSVAVKSGFSLTYPAVVPSYDPADPTNSALYGRLLGADRPRINEPGVSGLDATQTPAFTVATPTINYIAIQGLEFVASGAAAGGSGAAMGVSGSGAHTGIAYQNVVFNRVGFVFDIDETANQANWGSTFLVSKAAGGGTNNGSTATRVGSTLPALMGSGSKAAPRFIQAGASTAPAMTPTSRSEPRQD